MDDFKDINESFFFTVLVLLCLYGLYDLFPNVFLNDFFGISVNITYVTLIISGIIMIYKRYKSIRNTMEEHRIGDMKKYKIVKIDLETIGQPEYKEMKDDDYK